LGLKQIYRKWQFEKAVSDFGFQKYKQLPKEAYPVIELYLKERKRRGKDTIVFFSGQPMHRRKIQKYSSRYRDKKIDEDIYHGKRGPVCSRQLS
jgi:hypothetical protein